MGAYLCCSILCDEDNSRYCQAIVRKGNHLTGCKRISRHYDEFEKKVYCDNHFDVNIYLEKKYPRSRRGSEHKQNAFRKKHEELVMEHAEANQPSLDSLSLSGDSSG